MFDWKKFLLFHDLPSTWVEGEPQDIYCEEVPFDGTDNFETDDKNHCIPFNEFYYVSQDCFKEMVDVDRCQLQDIRDWEKYSSSSKHWWNYKKERLTSLRFYSVAVKRFEPSKNIHSMLYTKLSTPGMSHGILHEAEALRKYVKSLTA